MNLNAGAGFYIKIQGHARKYSDMGSNDMILDSRFSRSRELESAVLQSVHSNTLLHAAVSRTADISATFSMFFIFSRFVCDVFARLSMHYVFCYKSMRRRARPYSFFTASADQGITNASATLSPIAMIAVYSLFEICRDEITTYHLQN